MARKSREALEEIEAVKARLEEVQKIQELAEQEEKETLEKMITKIDTICNANNLFCGVIVDTNTLLSLVRLAIESKESIRIPYRLYFKE